MQQTVNRTLVEGIMHAQATAVSMIWVHEKMMQHLEVNDIAFCTEDTVTY